MAKKIVKEKLKKIDMSQQSFMANGKEYLIYDDLSIERFIEFEKLQAEVGFGFDFQQVFNKIKDAYEDLNKSKVADAGVKLHNLMKGIADRIDGRKYPIFMLCALFICTEDEDRKRYDKKVMEKKIEDWTAEGLDAESFFLLGLNLVVGFIPIFEETTQNISGEKDKEGKS